MPTLLHEGILALVRERPVLAADFLRELLGVRVPEFREARLTEAALPELVPTEYHADLAVLLVRDRPVLGVVMEVQLAPKRRKRYTWPLYATAGRARYECPFVLVVIAPTTATASWARRPIDLGDGNTWTPQVLGPMQIPEITDPVRAVQSPELAVLSTIAHGRGPVEIATAIAIAALAGLEHVPPRQRLVYSALIEQSLGEPTRKRIEMHPENEKLLEKLLMERDPAAWAKATAKARAEGKLAGEAEALLRVLERRGLVLTEDQRARISASADPAELERWLDRSVSIAHANELFG